MPSCNEADSGSEFAVIRKDADFRQVADHGKDYEKFCRWVELGLGRIGCGRIGSDQAKSLMIKAIFVYFGLKQGLYRSFRGQKGPYRRRDRILCHSF